MNAISKPASNDAFQGALDRVFKKSRCDHRKPSDSESRVAAEMLRQMNLGNIAIDFTDPDTCSAEWSEEAVAAVIAVILRENWSLVVSEWLEEFVCTPYPMGDLIKQHPDYPAKVEAWEVENGKGEGPDPMTVWKDQAEQDLCYRRTP